MAHLLRVFFTGAYRKPREVTWLIGVTMFALAMIEGFLGYSLPDDQLSGTGIRIAEGVLEGVPVAGPSRRSSCSAASSRGQSSSAGSMSSTCSSSPG